MHTLELRAVCESKIPGEWVFRLTPPVKEFHHTASGVYLRISRAIGGGGRYSVRAGITGSGMSVHAPRVHPTDLASVSRGSLGELLRTIKAAHRAQELINTIT